MPYIGTRPHWYLRDRARGLYGPRALDMGGGVAFPLSLGASLYDMWDAERPGDVDLSGSAVTAWRSAKNGYSAAQGVGASRPVYSATSFNGRPGLTFDGADDYLELASQPLPSGSTACEIWVLTDQTALVADATSRRAVSYGSATLDRRDVVRTVSGGVNRALAAIGNGVAQLTAIDSAVNLSGRHAIRMIVGTGQTDIGADDAGYSGVVITPATAATGRVRLGANANVSPGNYWQGVHNIVLITAPLTAPQIAQMWAFLKARGGIA